MKVLKQETLEHMMPSVQQALREILQDHFSVFVCDCTWFGDKRNGDMCQRCEIEERFAVLFDQKVKP